MPRRTGSGWTGHGLARDMDDPAIAQQLDRNLTLARKLGIEGTPAIIIGGTLIPGRRRSSDLQKAVDQARSTKG